MRLRTLPLALASIGMGSFLSLFNGFFSIEVFVLSLCTAMSLQVLSNLANDYGDAKHGADSLDRKGPARAVQSGAISAEAMLRAIYVCGAVTVILGCCLLYFSGLSVRVLVIFLLLGLVSIAAAVLYTNGRKPYGYAGLGDLAVFLFFGLLGVLGTYFLHTGHCRWDLVLPGTALGLLTVAVLNVNNIRDIESDRLAGKRSIPARLGRQRATYYHMTLLVVSVLCAVAYNMLHYYTPLQFVFLLVLPLFYINIHAVKTKLAAGDLDPYLKQMAISTLFFVISFGIGINMELFLLLGK